MIVLNTYQFIESTFTRLHLSNNSYVFASGTKLSINYSVTMNKEWFELISANHMVRITKR